MSWPLIKLKNCCQVVGGATPKRNVDEYWSSPDVPWVTPKDVSKLNSPILEDSPEYISNKGFKKCAAFMLPKGSVLVTSRAPIGNVAIAGKNMCTNQGFKSLIPNENVDGLYLYYCMLARSANLQALGNGATFKEVSKKIVEEFEIPLPPLAEQKRIAAILDKADAIRRQRQQAIKLADDFLRSVFLDMFGDPIANNKKWVVTSLGTLAPNKGDMVDGPFGSSVDTKTDYIEHGEIPVIRTKNISLSGEFISNDLKFMTRDKYLTIFRSNVIPGDIVLTKVGTIGNVCIFPEQYKEAVLSTTGSCRIRIDESNINKTYLFYFLKYYRPKMHEIASAGVQPFLNMKHIKGFQVPMPDRELQNKFETLVQKLAASQKILNKASKKKLFESLSQKAFAGEL